MKIRILLTIVIMTFMLACAHSETTTPKKGDTVSDNPVVVMKTNLGEVTIELWPGIAPKTVANFLGLAAGTTEWIDNTGAKVKKPFYNGLTFHRVIKDFMIQGGCPKGDGTGGPGYQFEDECFGKGPQVTELTSDEDVVSMLNAYMPVYFQSTPEAQQDPEIISLLNEINQAKSFDPIRRHPMSWWQQKTGVSFPVYSRGELKAQVLYGTICMANSGPNTNGSQFFIVTRKDGCNWLDGRHTVFGKVIAGMDVVDAIGLVETGPNDKPAKPVVIEKIELKK